MITVSDPKTPPVTVVSQRVESTLAAYRTARWINDTGLAITWALAALAVVALVACSLDAYFGWLSAGPRWFLWGVAVIATLTAGGRVIWRTWRLQQQRPLVAAEADAAEPRLEERLQTVTFFAADHVAVGRADRRMLTQVAREADALAAGVEPSALINRSLFRTPLFLLASAGVLFATLWLVTSTRDVGVLIGRFVAPWSSWTRTGIAEPLEAAVVGKGEAWRLEASTSGSPVSIWRLEERPLEPSEAMPVAVSQDRRIEGPDADELRYTRTNATDSFEYRVTAGDYRSEWMTVTVARRPELVDASVKITPPPYTDWKPKQVAGWPRELKMLAGSVVDFAIVADVPDTTAELRLTTGRDGSTVGTRSLVSDGTGTLRGAVRVDQNQVATLVLTEPNGLENNRRYAIRLIANIDKAPVVKVKSPTPETTVRPDDTVTVTFEARDDVGIAYAELEVFGTDAETGEQRTKAVIPVPVPEGKENRKLTGKAKIDLSQFELETGDTLDYRIRVFDKKQFAEATERPVSESNGNRTGIEAETMVPTETATPQDATPSSDNASADSSRETPSDSTTTEQPSSTTNQSPNEADATRSTVNGTPSTSDSTDRNTERSAASEAQESDADGATDSPSKMSNEKNTPASNEAASPANRSDRTSDPSANESAADMESASGSGGNPPPQNGANEPGAREMESTDVDDGAVRVGTSSERDDSPNGTTSNGNASVANDDSMENADPSASGGQGSTTPNDSESNSSRPPSSDSSDDSQKSSGGRQMKGDFSSTLTPQPTTEPRESSSQPGDESEEPDALQNPSVDSGDMKRRMLDVNRDRVGDDIGSASNQMRLKIDENAGSFAGEARRKLEIAIQPVLSDLKAWLGASSQLDATVISRQERGESWGVSDEESINRSVSYLDKSIKRVDGLLELTDDTPYAFIGLQLGDIVDNQIQSARTDLLASLEADAESRAPLVNTAHVATEYAIKRLTDLTTTFERERREQEVADRVQELERMYQVFIEDTMASLGSAKNALNDYDRNMAEVNPDDEYLERLREVLQMREQLKAELASILTEDPRLLRRFTQQFIDKGDTLRDQVTLLHYRQRQLAELGNAQIAHAEDASEVADGSAKPEDRDVVAPAVWNVQWEEGFAIGAEIPGIAERFETWLPLTELPDDLSLKAARGALKDATIAAAEFQQRIAKFRTGQSSDAGGSLPLRGSLLEARDHLLTLGATAERPEITNDSLRRILELDDVIEKLSAWTVKQQSLEEGDVALALGVDQHRVMTDTRLIGDKLANLEQQLASLIPPRDGTLPANIAELSRRMLSTLDNDVGGSQLAASFAFRKQELDKGTQRAAAANESFEQAEVAFDQLMRAVIEILDQEPAGDPIAALLQDPTLEEILAALENESDLLENLGIPSRAFNIEIINDWMSPAKNGGGGGGGGSSSMAGGALTQNAQQQQQRLQEFRQRLRQTLEQYNPRMPSRDGADGPITRWGKVVSQLENGLLQDNADKVPERYRRPIEQYFEAIGREQ